MTNATLRESEMGINGKIIETWWSAFVSCYPSCPSRLLFGETQQSRHQLQDADKFEEENFLRQLNKESSAAHRNPSALLGSCIYKNI
jgi:hypothetical protein